MLQRCVTWIALLLLAACQSYDFTLNDKIVYTPKPLFDDYDIVDPALASCVQQAIADARVSSASQLSALNCSNAGIVQLDGLALFTGLRQLKLSANAITDISELAQLSAVTDLYLDQNQITDALPLAQLPSLQQLDLSANPGLRCPDRNALLRVAQLTLPDRCD